MTAGKVFRVGAAAALVSTLNVWVLDGAETLPDGSLAVAVIVCEPWVNGVVGVNDQFPVALTTAVPMITFPSLTVIVAPASLIGSVPEIVGVAVALTELAVGVVITGATGGVSSLKP